VPGLEVTGFGHQTACWLYQPHDEASE